jgi:hypothetical protein
MFQNRQDKCVLAASTSLCGHRTLSSFTSRHSFENHIHSHAVTENNESDSARKTARRQRSLEALVLFVFAWIAAMITSLLRPVVTASGAHNGVLAFIGQTFLSGLECFVFGYILSRFFKQYKTGCALVIILFFAYLIWTGRR